MRSTLTSVTRTMIPPVDKVACVSTVLTITAVYVNRGGLGRTVSSLSTTVSETSAVTTQHVWMNISATSVYVHPDMTAFSVSEKKMNVRLSPLAKMEENVWTSLMVTCKCYIKSVSLVCFTVLVVKWSESLPSSCWLTGSS